jgi:hypothetical protein
MEPSDRLRFQLNRPGLPLRRDAIRDVPPLPEYQLRGLVLARTFHDVTGGLQEVGTGGVGVPDELHVDPAEGPEPAT